MPSILTEISFLSNPADEKLLKQPEQRQRVAEAAATGKYATRPLPRAVDQQLQ